MSKASQPELKKFMDKKLFIHLQGGRKTMPLRRRPQLKNILLVMLSSEETVFAVNATNYGFQGNQLVMSKRILVLFVFLFALYFLSSYL
ncbi:small nuclear ribonucleo G [Pyrrhoderma noxium]|uniref:Small nuclear ribonucleo G n=1 Tax=Pyrrhoderma noxium TaxID=2282107 RepID=A0A286UN25_9AGAM|nr:small nuclear ribonucleo G [Pyrrhoderma noxium]